MSVVAMQVPASRQQSRPTLRLVPTGPECVVDVPVLPVPSVRPVRRAAVAASLAVRPAPVRLTRRGRLVRTLVAFAVLCLLASLAVARLAAPGPLVADRVVIVQPGQTLTQIAREQLPQRPVAEGIELLRELNAMNSTVLVAGQSLLIPAG